MRIQHVPQEKAPLCSGPIFSLNSLTILMCMHTQVIDLTVRQLVSVHTIDWFRKCVRRTHHETILFIANYSTTSCINNSQLFSFLCGVVIIELEQG